MAAYLDKTGLTYFWGKIKDYVDSHSGGGEATILGGVNGTETTVSVASGTSVGSIASFSLTTGIWQVHVYARFASNATGRRLICLSTVAADAGSGSWNRAASTAINGTYTYLHINTTWQVTGSSQTVYVNGYQNSGSSLSTLVTWNAVRIG